MRSSNDSRMQERGAQTRSWAAPMPIFGQIPPQTARTRVEWDTRDTANNRIYSDIQVTGPKVVTSAALARHPTHGAEPFMPTVSRNDENLYREESFFPDSRGRPSASGMAERARLPQQDTSRNPFTSSIEGPDLLREVQRSIVEDNRFRNTDTDARIIHRVFTDQLVTPEMTRSIVERQVAAAEQLRGKSG